MNCQDRVNPLPKLLAATPAHPALRVLERFLDVSTIAALRTKEDAALRAGKVSFMGSPKQRNIARTLGFTYLALQRTLYY